MQSIVPPTNVKLLVLSYHSFCYTFGLMINDKYYFALNILTEFSHVSFKVCDKVHHFCLRDFPSCLFYLAKEWKRTAFSQSIYYLSSKSYTVKFNEIAMLIPLISLKSLRMKIILPFSSGVQELSSNFCKLIVFLESLKFHQILYCTISILHAMDYLDDVA